MEINHILATDDSLQEGQREKLTREFRRLQDQQDMTPAMRSEMRARARAKRAKQEERMEDRRTLGLGNWDW